MEEIKVMSDFHLFYFPILFDTSFKCSTFLKKAAEFSPQSSSGDIVLYPGSLSQTPGPVKQQFNHSAQGDLNNSTSAGDPLPAGQSLEL